MGKQWMLVVDTEMGFVQRFEKKLCEEGIEDLYGIQSVFPKTVLDKEAMIRECLRQVREELLAKQSVIGIFVDIVINHSGDGDTTGVDIAQAIREEMPSIPLFLVTGVDLREKVPDFFSEATLEDVDGVFVKGFLDGKYSSARRIKGLFDERQLEFPSDDN
jgi:hypothetical protein